MPTIYLLRHCDYDNPRQILPGRLPVELSVAGQKKAKELQEFFAKERISRIYSSAVLRCRQTAEIIANGQIPVVFDQRLLETLSAYQGYWIRESWQNFFAHNGELGGEGILDIQKRMVDFYQDLLPQLQKDERVIICSHGDPLQTLYAHLHNLELSEDKHLPETKEAGWLQKGEFFQFEI